MGTGGKKWEMTKPKVKKIKIKTDSKVVTLKISFA